MQKTVVLTLDDFRDYIQRQTDRENLADALKGKREGVAYILSRAGILFEGKNGHTDVFFRHRELFLRFSQACRAAQQGFVDGVDRYLRLEQTDVFIQVGWGASDRQRTIKASIVSDGFGRSLTFDLT